MHNSKKMGSQISSNFNSLIDNYTIKDTNRISSFERIAELNHTLISRGLSKPRGFNLLTTEEIYNRVTTASFVQTTEFASSSK